MRGQIEELRKQREKLRAREDKLKRRKQSDITSEKKDHQSKKRRRSHEDDGRRNRQYKDQQMERNDLRDDLWKRKEERFIQQEIIEHRSVAYQQQLNRRWETHEMPGRIPIEGQHHLHDARHYHSPVERSRIISHSPNRSPPYSRDVTGSPDLRTLMRFDKNPASRGRETSRNTVRQDRVRTTREHPKAFDTDKDLKNDYSQHFVDTGERPQNFIRDANMQDRFEEYPALRMLFKHKNELIAMRATPPFYMKINLKEFQLPCLGALFDVVLIDPPWEEYYNRTAHISLSVTDSKPYWTYEEIAALDIGGITASPSFVFLWVGSGGEALDLGRHLLQKWGFRRSEDIVWVKTNKENSKANINAARDKTSTFLRTKEHCLMGIKGSVRRNKDPHYIHANVDTDVIIAEESPLGSLKKPEELYHVIEHFCLGRRRLELFGEDHNIRPGWVTLGNKISSSNWNLNSYLSYFEGPNGHLLGTTQEIEKLRPKSPNRDDSKLIFFDLEKGTNKGPPEGIV